MVWVWEFSRSKGLDKLVLLSLANRHNLERRACWPSRSTIATDCGVHDATVKRCLDNLVNLGEVSIEERPRESGPHQSNLYRLPLVEKWLAEGRSRHPGGAHSTSPRGADSAKGGCSQRPEPVIEPVKNKNLRPLARPSSTSCGKSVTAKPSTPQQRRFAIVGSLAELAFAILTEKPGCQIGDLTEELKQRAANNGVPYFDAWPGAATPIEQAITIAIERRKTA
jgi:Helix-turn-helix domain